MLAVAEDPDDEMSRVLILAKSDLGRLDVPALRYRVEGRKVVTDEGQEITTSGIAWLGEAPGVGAADIFASGDPEDRSIAAERAETLREILADGPLERKTVLANLKDGAHGDGQDPAAPLCGPRYPPRPRSVRGSLSPGPPTRIA